MPNFKRGKQEQKESTESTLHHQKVSESLENQKAATWMKIQFLADKGII